MTRPLDPVPSSPGAWLWAVAPDHYPVFAKTETFAIRKVGRKTLQTVRPGDAIFVYLSGSRVIAGMFEAVGTAFQDTTPLVTGGNYPHRIRVRPVVALSREAWVPYEAFSDQLSVVRDYDAFRSVVQQVIHPLPKVDEKVLEFLVRARQAADLNTVLQAYDAYLKARDADSRPEGVAEPVAPYTPEPPEPAPPFDPEAGVEALIAYVEARGFAFEPWQLAAYYAALRTKPFVILAGVSGTGKSKLPTLVAEGTGHAARLLPVRPDWTDPAEVIGYTDLQGRFRPGALLQAARAARDRPDRHLTFVLDEMNVARVEHYFADVLSRIETRRREPDGRGYASPPLLSTDLAGADPVWSGVPLPANLALVGTVNTDESTHGFSLKVIDRAFTLELEEVDLAAWNAAHGPAEPARWPVDAWYPRAATLHDLDDLDEAARASIDRTVEVLTAVNRHLAPAGLQVAYRTRDETALFVLHARACRPSFRTRAGAPVDPLDLALVMKVLPRITGSLHTLRRALTGLLGWSVRGRAFRDDEDARTAVEAWLEAGLPADYPDAQFPRTAARLCRMWDQLVAEGYTTFWA